MEYRPTRDCERRVELYANLADESRATGSVDEANRFLLLAWAAYDGADEGLAEDAFGGGDVYPLQRRS